MKKQFIETGKITGTHGIRGEMRVQPWSDSPEFLTQFDLLYLDGKVKTWFLLRRREWIRSNRPKNTVIV